MSSVVTPRLVALRWKTRRKTEEDRRERSRPAPSYRHSCSELEFRHLGQSEVEWEMAAYPQGRTELICANRHKGRYNHDFIKLALKISTAEDAIGSERSSQKETCSLSRTAINTICIHVKYLASNFQHLSYTIYGFRSVCVLVNKQTPQKNSSRVGQQRYGLKMFSKPSLSHYKAFVLCIQTFSMQTNFRYHSTNWPEIYAE